MTLRSFAVAAALNLVLAAGAGFAQEAVRLDLTFTDIKTPSGALFIALFDSEQAYKSGKPTQVTMAPVSGPQSVAVFEGLKPGTYAVRLFHDLDGDGKMGTNGFGIPTEPFAFSNGAQAMMGPPSWGDAAFEIGPAGAAQSIQID